MSFSNWKFVKAGFPQSFVEGPLFFIIYIIDLLQEIMYNVKFLVDYYSLILIVNCEKTSVSALNSNFLKVQDWSY